MNFARHIMIYGITLLALVIILLILSAPMNRNGGSLQQSTGTPISKRSTPIVTYKSPVVVPKETADAIMTLVAGPPPNATQIAIGKVAALFRSLYDGPGVLISQGQNTTPVGRLGLKTYRLEELTLPAPTDIPLADKTITTDKVWRLIVTGGPFKVTAVPPSVSLGGRFLGQGWQSPDTRALRVLVFDRSLLRNGGTIAVSYGAGSLLSGELPEQLKPLGP